MATPVYLEVGKKKTFACSVDWPGWARAGRDEDAALSALASYADRYRSVADVAGVRFPRTAADALDVVDRLAGDGTTDFGAPGQIPAFDASRLTKAQAERLAALVEATWTSLDRIVATAPASLRKGPRGGGRDRDRVWDHVLDAEASYFRLVGVSDGRAGFLRDLRAARAPQPELTRKSWPWRYAARRVAWHALDHAWEIEDRSE